ncbi:hypothetical protein LSH36_835g00039 [Paralvinella palmiformis]|uniref:Calx-beta domain-containing protein n=1 Tax=Paralvinella palmiformis TaxID=53620 RepID=A0AAD9IZK9_9ANNE|nr:hypothetical protein LSH36_835g00039 [Paralvinella palmiformis]
MQYIYSNYSNGWVVEAVEDGSSPCESWLMLPAENLWSVGMRGFLYILALVYIFLGIAIVSDIFMCSIEVITSQRKTVVKWDEENQAMVEKHVLIWNETVANLTLMALGSSAPEILLSVLETLNNLGSESLEDGLGPFTIIGSAAFNLLIITAICISSVPSPGVKRVQELGVFIMTSIWSIFAYLWLLITLSWISPGVIEVWEAWVTFACFPVLVLIAYIQDNGWWCYKCRKTGTIDTVQSEPTRRLYTPFTTAEGSDPWLSMSRPPIRIRFRIRNIGTFGGMTASTPVIGPDATAEARLVAMAMCSNVRVIDKRRASMVQGISKELGALEREKHHSVTNLNGGDQKRRNSIGIRQQEEGSQTRLVSSPARSLTPGTIANKNLARARFRHAAIRSLLGGKKRPLPNSLDIPRQKDHVPEGISINQGNVRPEDLVGKFTIASPSYSVLESAGIVTIDVLFHRFLPGLEKAMVSKKDTILLALFNYYRITIRCCAGYHKTISCDGDNGYNKQKKGGSQTSENETSFVNNNFGTVSVEYETREGSGRFDKDFKYTSGKLTFTEEEYKKSITVPIINDNQYEADVDFYIVLKNPNGNSSIGDPSVSRVTIIDDDEPGEFQFSHTHYYADMNAGIVSADVIRQKGCDGTVTIEFSTIDGTAHGGDAMNDKADYRRDEGVLKFLHNESSKTITIGINKECKTSKNFIIALKNPSLGAKIGEHGAAVAYLNEGSLNERIASILDDDDEDMTWAGQFKAALTIEGSPDAPLLAQDYILHFLSFFWKVLFAFIPPRQYFSAWPCFISSLIFIGTLTAVVEQLGALLGCVLGIKASLAGITIIALGTSLPDTFASRTAALHDEGADAAIGNVTGSNSVNVFLGLGLPWVISTSYALVHGTTFRVPTGNIVQSVVVFAIVGTICIIFLLIRRKAAGGELGGSKLGKYLSSAFLACLWLIYIVLSALQAYTPSIFPWS